MTAADGNPLRHHVILDAVEDLRNGDGIEPLWSRLHQALAYFGIGEVMYGNKVFACAPGPFNVFMSTFDEAYLRDKTANGLLDADHYVQAVQVETAPILWSETMRLRDVPALTQRSLTLDWDYGVLVGVSLPLRFNHGLGVGGFGLHAPTVTWVEFERIWTEFSASMRLLCHAFDARMREANGPELFALTPRERDCLLYLAAGQRPQQIAYRFGTHVKTVEKQIETTRHKLKAATNAQAVAVALMFGLITP